MATDPYKVSVVVDREFGERLIQFEASAPVWVVDTASNGPVARRLGKERYQDHLQGITLFRDSPSLSPEQLLMSVLEEIELHHGSLSHDPAYTILGVFGAEISDKLKTEFAGYGFSEFRPLPGVLRRTCEWPYVASCP